MESIVQRDERRTATILLVATNAGIIGVSRLVHAMGIHRQVPGCLRRLHPRYNTP